MELFLELLNGAIFANTGNEIGQSDSPSIFRTLQLQ